jgi:hypothetical protein
MAAKNPAAPPPTMMICLELTREELQNFRRARRNFIQPAARAAQTSRALCRSQPAPV